MATKQFELTAVNQTGLLARGEVDYLHLGKLVGLTIEATEKTEPDKHSPKGYRGTHMVTSASVISAALSERAKQKIMTGRSAEADILESEWWAGYDDGAIDGSIGAYKHSPSGVREFAVAKAAEGKKLEAAKWNGYLAAMFKRPGENVPIGPELIIPIAAGRVISLEVAA